jgi:hypothetical protein
MSFDNMPLTYNILFYGAPFYQWYLFTLKYALTHSKSAIDDAIDFQENQLFASLLCLHFIIIVSSSCRNFYFFYLRFSRKPAIRLSMLELIA